ncbi:MAG: GxxExxY protein [Opitutales bacterium]
MEENEIGKIVVDAAVKVHSALGPGLLESVYEAVLAKELEGRSLSVVRQVAVPIEYAGMKFDEGFRADLIVEGKVILELKSVEQMSKVHHKQLFTYLKLKELKLGYLLNFGAPLIKDGIKRMVNGLENDNLGVLGSLPCGRLRALSLSKWRDSKMNGQPGGDLNSDSLRSSP